MDRSRRDDRVVTAFDPVTLGPEPDFKAATNNVEYLVMAVGSRIHRETGEVDNLGRANTGAWNGHAHRRGTGHETIVTRVAGYANGGSRDRQRRLGTLCL